MLRNTDITTFRQRQVLLPASIIHCRPNPLTDSGKTRILAGAIIKAQTARGAVELRDLTLAGISEPDAKRLYDAALVKAKTLDPGLFRAVAA